LSSEPTSKQRAAMNLYCALLEEVKARLVYIERGLSGDTRLPGPLLREFLYLQLRMLCEVIALGCLTVHGDIGTAPVGKLRKEWDANKIMDELGKLHSDFYPRPILLEQKAPHRFHLTELSADLTKDQLLALYGRCGNVLHRGTVKKLLTEKMPLQTHFPDVVDWATKITHLLGAHGIALFGGQRLVCVLRAKNNAGHAHVALASAI